MLLLANEVVQRSVLIPSQPFLAFNWLGMWTMLSLAGRVGAWLWSIQPCIVKRPSALVVLGYYEMIITV
jgi:hypothetical protein